MQDLTPIATKFARGALLFTKTTYTPNDQVHIEYGTSQNACCGPQTIHVYDDMDRLLEISRPRRVGGAPRYKTEFKYDAAGRMIERRSQEQQDKGYATYLTYDALDRLVTERWSSPTGPRRTHHCYSDAGDLILTVAPEAGLTEAPETNCDSAGSYRTRFFYDLAHRQEKIIDPKGG
jgi:YD repeat-containing protein